MDIFVASADGSNPVRLTQGPGYNGSPAWSPDGRRVAFTSSRDGDPQKRAMHVYVMDADGSNVRKLTP